MVLHLPYKKCGMAQIAYIDCILCLLFSSVFRYWLNFAILSPPQSSVSVLINLDALHFTDNRRWYSGFSLFSHWSISVVWSPLINKKLIINKPIKKNWLENVLILSTHCFRGHVLYNKVIINVGEHIDHDLLKHSESLQA